jgi:hypothetical protein
MFMIRWSIEFTQLYYRTHSADSTMFWLNCWNFAFSYFLPDSQYWWCCTQTKTSIIYFNHSLFLAFQTNFTQACALPSDFPWILIIIWKMELIWLIYSLCNLGLCSICRILSNSWNCLGSSALVIFTIFIIWIVYFTVYL